MTSDREREELSASDLGSSENQDKKIESHASHSIHAYLKWREVVGHGSFISWPLLCVHTVKVTQQLVSSTSSRLSLR